MPRKPRGYGGRAPNFIRLFQERKIPFHAEPRQFDKMDFSLDDVYRSLSFFAKFKDPMLLAMHKRIEKLYGRDTSLVYYDVTNYSLVHKFCNFS